MFRYRCPHCTKLLQAPELRAGKTTVCSKCSQPLTIPSDKSEWLNERGEPLLTSPTVVIRTLPSVAPDAEPESQAEPDTDVLGAIFLNATRSSDSTPSADLGFDVRTPGGLSAALHTLLGESESAVRSEPAPESKAESSAVPEPDPAPEPDPVAADESPESTKGQHHDEPNVPEPNEPVVQPELESPPLVARENEDVEPAVLPNRIESIPEPPRAPAAPARAFPRPSPPNVPEPHAPAAVATEPPIPSPRPGLPVPSRGTVRSAIGERPIGPQASVGSPDAGSNWGRNSQPSPPRPRRLVATTPVPPRRGDDDETVTFGDPLRLKSQMDIAAELTSALTSRMKPPPQPPRDLKPSTALWLLVTGVAVALLVLTLVTANQFSEIVLALGAGQIVVGYLWAVWLAARRDWRRGLACAVPPITLWYLTQRKYAKYRPLRFVATGAILATLAGIAGYVQPHTRSWAGVPEAAALPVPPVDIASQPKLVQLQYYRDRRSYDSLMQVLRTLSRTDPVYSEEAKNRTELVAELRALCDHRDSDVKVEAMAAYATWGGSDARRLCLEATRSTNQEERMMALRLLTRWKDPEVARAVASRIGRAGTETSRAQESLIDIGGPIAERAAIPLLRSDDQGVRLTVIELLGNEKVGGEDAVAALLDVAKTANDPGTRQPAASKAEQIQARLKK